MSDSSRTYLGLGAVAAGIALLVYAGSGRLSKNHKSNVDSSADKSSRSHAPAIVVATEYPIVGKSSLSVGPNRAAQSYSKALELGLSEIPSKSVGNLRSFVASVSLVDGSCQTGDGDLLKAASETMKERKWLFTIESLSNPGLVFSRKLLNLTEIASNSAFEVSLPRDNSDDLALFFCQDSGNQGSCGKKSNLNKKDWKAVAKSGKLADRLIYFQLLSQNKTGLYLIPSAKWDNATLSSLSKSLGPWLDKPSSSLEKMGQYLDALTPRPAKLKATGIQIPLPSRSRGC